MGKVLFVKTYQKLTKCEQDMEMLLHTLVASDLWCSMSRKGIQTQEIILRLDQHCSAILFPNLLLKLPKHLKTLGSKIYPKDNFKCLWSLQLQNDFVVQVICFNIISYLLMHALIMLQQTKQYLS